MVQIKRVSNAHLPCSIPSGVARNPLGCLLIQLDLNVEYQKIELVIQEGCTIITFVNFVVSSKLKYSMRWDLPKRSLYI